MFITWCFQEKKKKVFCFLQETHLTVCPSNPSQGCRVAAVYLNQSSYGEDGVRKVRKKKVRTAEKPLRQAENMKTPHRKALDIGIKHNHNPLSARPHSHLLTTAPLHHPCKKSKSTNIYLFFLTPPSSSGHDCLLEFLPRSIPGQENRPCGSPTLPPHPPSTWTVH